MKGLFITLLGALLLASFSCTTQTVQNPPAQNEPAATAQNNSTTPGKSETKVIVKNDSTTSGKVKSRLTSSNETRTVKVNVETNEGVVTLTGTVPSAAMRARVEQIARETEGVTQVINNIIIDPRAADAASTREKTDAQSGKSNDATILTKIHSQLVTEGINGAQVASTDGYVLLKGEVANAQEKARAEAIARKTEGVRGVTNQLAVKTRSGDKSDDATIMTKIKSQLVVEGIMGANVAVNNGYVLLKGEVENPQEKANAEAIARKTEGVRGVTNQLAVKRVG